MSILIRNEFVRFLLKRKFLEYKNNLTLPVENITGYPDDAIMSVDDIFSYEKTLSSMSMEKIQKLYKHEIANLDIDDILQFFSRPYAKADITHWSKAAQWTLDEAIALSFGKDPEVVNWESIKSLIYVSKFAHQYSRVRDLALRAKEQHQIHDPVIPGVFLAWAKRNDIDFPTELEEQVNARGQQIADWKSKYDELKEQFDKERLAFQSTKGKPLGTRERQSALKLIIGLAIWGSMCSDKSCRFTQCLGTLGTNCAIVYVVFLSRHWGNNDRSYCIWAT